MNTDLATQILSAQQGQTRALVQVAVLRQAQQADQQLLQMIEDGTQNIQAPAPSGQGLVVDKTA